MSGGSYNYAYIQLEEFAGAMKRTGGCSAAPCHVRQAFAAHLEQCAKAMRAIEWNDSGDGDSDEEMLIRGCLGGAKVLAALIDEAGDVMKRLRTETEHANRRQP